MEVQRALAREKSKGAPREQRKRNVPGVAGAGEQSPRFDIMSREKRSALMGRIRGRNTAPELTVRHLLHAMGYRYRLHAGDLPGKPDIVFRSRRIVVFVHGCFWHRHDCGLAYVPKTRSEFWQRKFDGNVARDLRTKRELEAAGWRVVLVWECQLSDLAALSKHLAQELGRPDISSVAGRAKARRSEPKTRAQARSARQ
ncbi:very short patch repair endonuclease [Bradyrhizobium sp. SZCCHNPS10062]|uniref:very short patch repair endonuclease n=2 Tax=unclassified Bradyrhizobium TaxID=2631580 RepID=UPI0028E3FCEB|nr:very short patch repair endonuclease [Bradyrhizobium sp. SZCCHNPS10062]